MEEAARRAAKEVLREFSAQTPDVAELRETISATLEAVRKLEAATMERISTLAASMQTLPTGSSSVGVLWILILSINNNPRHSFLVYYTSLRNQALQHSNMFFSAPITAWGPGPWIGNDDKPG